jgi:dTDP-4-dehydrorhamnose reductase
MPHTPVPEQAGRAKAPPVVWVTGAGGLIGNYLVQVAPRFAPGWQVIGWTRPRLDLADSPALRTAFFSQRPDAVIHCAALSRSGACEKEPALARRVNVDVTARLCELASGIPVLFLSTDLVFDGRSGHYEETAAVGPLGVYGETKVAAERLVLANPKHTVIRTSLNYGHSPTGDRAFNEEMLRACRRGQRLKLFTDEFRSPIPAAVTAEVLWRLLQCGQPGLYHVAGAERLSRWATGRLLAGSWPELEGHLEPASLRDFAGPARPPDTSLNCNKVQRLLGLELPRFSAWLAEAPRPG